MIFWQARSPKRGTEVGCRHVTTLMARMGFPALAPQPGTSKRAPGHKIHPYLLRTLASVKYERVYLKAYDSVSTARADIADYLGWYNAHRSHSSLDRLTPDEAHFADLAQLKLAA